MNNNKKHDFPRASVGLVEALKCDFDYVIDLRSTNWEHWTYNYGMIHQVLECRSKMLTRIRVTKVLSKFLIENTSAFSI